MGGSETSSFGVSERANHDSERFYNQAIYDGHPTADDVEYSEQPLRGEHVNAVLCTDSRDLPLPDRSVHLVVTSPPYLAGKDYDEDLTLEEYCELLYGVFASCWRVLVPGGRIGINIANIGRSPYIPLHACVVRIMQDIGYLMRGEIIWDKGASAGSSCAWGSWQSASNPTLRDVHEYILVFSKQTFGRPSDDREDTITKDDFLDGTKSVWTMPTASAERIGHPAPFPEELPRRLIELYSFEDDVVLDPFAGSAQTAVAARSVNRRYVMVDNDDSYVELARDRLEKSG